MYINKVADYYKKSYYKAAHGKEFSRMIINQFKNVVSAQKHPVFYEKFKKYLLHFLAGKFYWPSSWPTSLDPESGELLYGLVRLLKPKVVLEIGTFKGYGAICIGQALKENGNGKLYTIDPVEQELVKIAIRKSGLKNRLEYIIDYSTDAVPKLRLQKIDFAMIDGDHSYESVKSDFEIVKPLIQKGGVVVFHDTIWFDGPSRVIKEIKQMGNFEIITFPTPVGVDKDKNAVFCDPFQDGIIPIGLSIIRKL